MDFRNFASTEAAALIGELVTAPATAARTQLGAVREALDEAARALSAPARLDDAVHELVSRLTAAFDGEIQKVREEADGALQAVRAELVARESEHQDVATALQQALTQLTRLTNELETERARSAAAEHEARRTLEAHMQLEAAFRKLEAELGEARHDAAVTATELSQAHTTNEELRETLAQLRETTARQSSDVEALNGELQEARQAFTQRDAAQARLQATLEQVRVLEGDLTEIRAKRQHLEGELACAHSARDQLDASLAASAARIDTLENEAAKAVEMRGQRDALAAELRTSAGRIRTLEADLARAVKIGEQRDALAAELDASSARVRTLETDLVKANEIREHRDSLIAQVAASNTRVQTLERSLAKAAEATETGHALSRQLDTAKGRLRALEEELANASMLRDQHEQLAAAAEAQASRLRDLENELATAREAQRERDALVQQLATTSSHALTIEQELTDLRAARAERDAFALQLDGLHAQLTGMAGELSEAQSARIERDQLALDLESLRSRTNSLERERAAAPDTSTPIAGADAVGRDVVRLASLVETSACAIRELGDIGDSSELLMELVKRLALQFSRAALFRVHGDRLVGEHQIGFDPTADVTSVVMPTSAESLLTRAITAGALQDLQSEDVSVGTGLTFVGSPRSAIALPITLNGSTIAVVYADDDDLGPPLEGVMRDAAIAFARLLAGQTEALLVRHTQQLKILAELRQYATTLLQEAREMYEADSSAGKPADLVRSRLKDNIDCASQLYTYRAAMEGTAAAALLDQEILAELQASTPFATDLAAVIGDAASRQLNVLTEN